MTPTEHLSLNHWEVAKVWSELSESQRGAWALANPTSCIFLGRELFVNWATDAKGSPDESRFVWALGAEAPAPQGEEFDALSQESQRVKAQTHLMNVKACSLAVKAFDEFSPVASAPPLQKTYQEFREELTEWIEDNQPIPSTELGSQFGPEDICGHYELTNTEAVRLKLGDVDPDFIWSTWWDDHGELLVPGVLRAGESFVVTRVSTEESGGSEVATQIRLECPLCHGEGCTEDLEECPVCEGNERITLGGL